ncbi:MAG: hypothetical protein HY319_25160 [Armatimonadetes bacterium]|nr:hypothetical protein [Armatimonadota bacterium]
MGRLHTVLLALVLAASSVSAETVQISSQLLRRPDLQVRLNPTTCARIAERFGQG